MKGSYDADLRRYWQSYMDLYRDQRTTEARAELRVVMSIFERCTYVEQVRFARELCERAFERREQPPLDDQIRSRVLLPYLKAASKLKRMPEVLWLAEFYGCDLELLEKALALDPGNDRAWTLLMETHVWALDYGSHHMWSEGYWVGPVSDIEEAIKQLTRLCQMRPDLATPALREFLRDQMLLLAKWEEYEGSGTGLTFLRWCEHRGYKLKRAVRPDLPDLADVW